MRKGYETKMLDAADVPDDMRVSCPITDGKLRRMSRCFEGCEFCKGVADINPNDPRWPVRYRLVCVHPVARQIHAVAED